MNSAHSNDNDNLVSLKKASEILGVSIEVLLDWNESNILKPAITQEGKVVYSIEQLEKFLSVQQNIINPSLSKKSRLTGEAPATPVVQKTGHNTGGRAPINRKSTGPSDSNSINTSSGTLSKIPVNKKPGAVKLITIGITTSILVVIISLSLTSPPKLDEEILQPETNLSLNESNAGNINSMDNNDFPKSGYEGHNQSLSVSSNKLSSAFSVFAERLSSSIGKVNKEASPLNLIAVGKTNELPNFGHRLINSYSSRPSIGLGLSSLYQESENGTIPDNYIASDLSTLINSTNPDSNTVGNIVIVFLLALGLSWVFYVYQNQPIFSETNSSKINSVVPVNTNNDFVKRFIEVEQKTDGTVVIYYQDQEYKVSKPELNSETDQFIQRILSLTDENTKEIKYDILKDDKIDLNAPLSKIVTRLGFVGTKRDLFFPRTSKNKVVFRKYLTEDEVSSMNLKDGTIRTELLS